MRLSDVFDPPVEPELVEGAVVVRHRRTVVGTTLAAGTAVLAATIAAPSGSGLFYGLGLLAAVIWIAGALMSGQVRLSRPGGTAARLVGLLGPVLLGVVFFAAFSGAKLIADGVPVLSGSVARILARADAGPRVLVLVVAIVNAIGEELFFRGALHSAFGKHHAAWWATAIYAAVTVATLNVALVAAAVIMGAVFAAERRATGGILAPILTHVTWSTLVIFFLPR